MRARADSWDAFVFFRVWIFMKTPSVMETVSFCFEGELVTGASPFFFVPKRILDRDPVPTPGCTDHSIMRRQMFKKGIMDP